MEQKHSHYGHRSRLRDRAKKEGLENFQDYQVLEYALSFVIPYKDTNPIAHELINKFGSLEGVLEAREEDLMNVKGMGEVSAHFLTSLIQIFVCYQREKMTKNGTLVNPQDTYNYLKGYFAGKLVEEVYLLSLLPNNKVQKVEKIGEGTIDNVKVAIRKVTDAISRNRVSSVILAHNHPSGVASPSVNDDNYTKALITTLAINDCTLVDHIIIGTQENDFYSYKQKGRIEEFSREVEGILRDISSTQMEVTCEVDNEEK